ncbi:MAG: trypsin-like peptidase domain-containing protein [Proteobacteria bacterium]|nr:trypsin-like peptidase domain-containing protein [Pseudomonadota bacterium]
MNSEISGRIIQKPATGTKRPSAYNPPFNLIKSLLLVCILLFVILLTPFLMYARDDKTIEVVEKVSKTIVNIKTEELSKNTGEDKKTTFFKKFIAGEEEEEETFENIGSGVVLDPRGIIVTNEHLISRAISIRVKFINGKEYDAYVLGSDPEFDMALLKITDKIDFPYLKVDKYKKVKVGEKAIVIGNPYGLSSSVTMGVVSALGRNLKIDNRAYVNLIQTDASINPGNSGGALLDTEGNPLGIVTAIYGEGKGIGFAIPIEDVMNMVSEFLESGTRKPLFGLFIEKRKDDKNTYFYVNKVISKSPAEKQGIKAGDRIVEFNKKKIREGIKIHNILRNAANMESIQFKIMRGQKAYDVDVDIGDMLNYKPSPLDEALCSIRVSDIKGYPKMKFKLKDKNGVVVTKVYKNGIGEKSGLHVGDVIIKINNYMVSDKKDFDSFMIEGLKRNYILYQVKRNETIFYVPVKLNTLL